MRKLLNVTTHLYINILIRLLGGNDMVTVYVTLIIKNAKKFAQVPKNLQPAVEKELLELGLGIDGKPLPVEDELVVEVVEQV